MQVGLYDNVFKWLDCPWFNHWTTNTLFLDELMGISNANVYVALCMFFVTLMLKLMSNLCKLFCLIYWHGKSQFQTGHDCRI